MAEGAAGGIGVGGAEGAGAGGQGPVGAGMRKLTLGNYGANYVNPNLAVPTIHAPVYGHTSCQIFFGDQDQTGNNQNLAFQLNLEAGQGQHAESPQARAAYYLGCIINIFPSRRDEFIRLASEAGYQFEVIRVPSRMAEGGVLQIPPVRLHPAKALAIFGYLVLMLFKQINENSYQRFTENRLRALCAIATYEVGETEEVTVFMDINHAKTYRTIFGQNFGLRKKILECMLEKRMLLSPLGSVCSYVCGILSWHEMTNLNFILETLMVTKSPVLLRPELATEVIAVKRAAEAVLQSPMPQFFRVLHPHAETQVLDRNNFPRLAAVASRIKSVDQKNAGQFVTTQPTESTKIQEYVNLHTAAIMGRDNTETLSKTVAFLTSFEDAQYED